jgi:predicted ATP-binding protein involved in virulence
LNPNLGWLAADQTSGIVLIDEVDMHLHPAWQQTVLASLREAFPRIQFIVTTHSPQVLTTVPAECIRSLSHEVDSETVDRKAVVRLFHSQTEGVASSTALAEIMNTDPIPDIEATRWLSRYKALIEQSHWETDEAKALRVRLVEHFGANHQLIHECDRLIRLQSYKAGLQSMKTDPTHKS